MGLGSNVGDGERNIDQALDRLGRLPGTSVVGASGLYRTEPVGLVEQEWFINAAAVLTTGLAPDDLLHGLLEIEKTMGRRRTVKWGPRLIDLDLLFYGDRRIDGAGLKVPHPLMAERRFVLVPLSEAAPDWEHPVTGLTAAEMLKRLAAEGQEVRSCSA